MPSLSPSWNIGSVSKEVVLAYPRIDVLRPTPPYPVWLLATNLIKAGYRPMILDERLCDGREDFLQRIRDAASRRPLFTGFSCSMAPQLVLAESYRRSLEEIGYPGPWAVGGIFASILPSDAAERRLFRGSGFQILSYGHSFDTVVDICRAIEGKISIMSVRGISYLTSSGEVVRTEPREFPSYLPVPDYDLIDVGRYVYDEDIFIGRLVRSFSLYTSTGCSYGCRFCLNARERKWVGQSSEEVLTQIRYLHDRHRVEYVGLIDDNPLLNPNRMLKVFRALDREGLDIKFYMDIAIPQILSNWFDEIAPRLAKVFVGAESGSEKILKLVAKHQNVSMIKEAVKVLDSKGVAARFSFLRKVPEEEADDVAGTMSLVDWIKRNHSNCAIQLADWMPIYETPLYMQHREHLTEDQARLAESGQVYIEDVWTSQKYREVM